MGRHTSLDFLNSMGNYCCHTIYMKEFRLLFRSFAYVILRCLIPKAINDIFVQGIAVF